MFDFTVTTPANTTKANPQRTPLPLRKGVIVLVHVAFPPGPQGFLHVLIHRGGATLWPENEGEGFVSDDFTIPFTPMLSLGSEPLTLTAVTYNLDSVHSHLVNLRFSVLDPEIALPQQLQAGVLQRLSDRLFRR